MRSVRSVVGVALCVLGGCARGDVSSKRVTAEAAADAMRSAVTDAVVRKDPSVLVLLFAADAVVVEPDGRILEGRPAIEARIRELLPGVQSYSLTSRKLEAGSDLAYDQQTFQLTLAGADSVPRTLVGHQLVVLRRRADGGWEIARSGSWIAEPADSLHRH